ncbi:MULTISPECIES: S9 family peptidase [Prauserella salsuginis group]|uniref:Prolyl oligopeptidase family serine peptidase n=1 Tax=Prauserella salsuginis TaxID=387889 RepID=A0ABW6G4L2_9PSEU|nr:MULTISPECIES: prolyl oligopeptidase family serine peptidase [Prauserella salsuginis group]MCR3718135.1 Dipeptidyl aminopeptidase/acylaminoacyl peptidase [Prauserella flava]MCR3732705.1 Dipeptidyl aminopeptidase/acylaminoacyl peptidase [Prauserella salsuginis]
MPAIAPFGTWPSPITAGDVAAAGVTPQWLDVVRAADVARGSEVWWAEARPAEGGRVALVRAGDDGRVADVLPAPWNVRNRLHEYGGRPWAVVDDTLVFTHWDDQRIHAVPLPDGAAATAAPVRPLTPEPDVAHGFRYGDLRPGPGGAVWAVRETVTGPRRIDIARDLVAVGRDGDVRSLAATHHFLTSPQLSPDGRRAAWLGWDHPAMPWDETSVCVAEVEADGTLGPPRVVAGGDGVSVCQLTWGPAGELLALADPSGWWNLHRVPLDGGGRDAGLVALAPVEAELGGAMWKTGARWLAPLDRDRYAVLASGRLAVLDTTSGTLTPVAPELTAWSPSIAVADGDVVGIAAGPHTENAVVRVRPADGTVTHLTPQPELPPAEYLSVPQERTFHTADGHAVPAYVYPPRHPDHAGPDDERPPYLVHAHGGPTGRNYAVLDLDFSYFTSRGIGVVAVDYGGSVGYGRHYRERLRQQWGVVDVADCAAVARALAEDGTADPERIAIRGGSAGGFTSAASMTVTDTYRAATIKFPILDLAQWTGDGGEVHDFESQYVYGLVGPLPETAERHRVRSPMHNLGGLAGPVLLLQGLDDEICPPDQAERFVEALEGSGIPHAYLPFEGEQHGFRGAATIVAALEAELAFYGQVFGFTPDVPPLELRR